jgi:TonB family protein
MNLQIKKTILTIGLAAILPLSSGGAQQDQTLGDKDVHVLDFEDMPYPPIARAAHVQGTVVVRVKLDDSGKVVDAAAISGPQLLILDVLTNVKKWVFKPNASKTAVIVYNFTILDGRCKSLSRLFVLQGTNIATVITCPSPTSI